VLYGKWGPHHRPVDCFAIPREYEDIVDGIAAGKYRIEVEDFDFTTVFTWMVAGWRASLKDG
jgi:hypothetical protein